MIEAVPSLGHLAIPAMVMRARRGMQASLSGCALCGEGARNRSLSHSLLLIGPTRFSGSGCGNAGMHLYFLQPFLQLHRPVV